MLATLHLLMGCFCTRNTSCTSDQENAKRSLKEQRSASAVPLILIPQSELGVFDPLIGAIEVLNQGSNE